jgi:[ribosomal protein S5]-alanine N-acetyltransferase
MNPMHVRIDGERLLLRDFTPEDIDSAHAIVGDDRVTRWLSFDARDHVQTAAMIHRVIRATRETPRTEYYLGVERAVDHDLVGFVRLQLGAHSSAKLGYAVHADHWGHGYATEAAATMLTFGFQELGLHRVTAAVGPENAPSIAVLTRLGFTLEGRLRHHVFTHEAWRDSLLYSLLADEFPR